MLYAFKTIYDTIRFLIKLLFWPIKQLLQFIGDFWSCTSCGSKLDDLNDRFHHFNGFIPFCLFIAGFIFSLVMLLVQIGRENSLMNHLETLLFYTPIGSFLGFISEGLNFTPATAVSIAFSGFLLTLCMGKEAPDGFVGFMIALLRHIVFFVASALLASKLTGVFQSLGNWGYHTLATLFSAKASNFFVTVGRILLFVLLCYPAIELLLLALKEYMDCILLGVVFLLLSLIVSILVQYVFRWENTLIFDIFSLVLIFGVDLFRPYVDLLMNKALSRFSLYSEDWVDDFGE